MKAVNVADALTLVLCFPITGLLLFALTTIEEQLPDERPPDQPPSAHPTDQAERETGPGPADRGALIRWPAGRVHRKQPPVTQAPAADGHYSQAG